MSTSRILSIKVTYPDQFLEPSTFDLQFLGASDFGSGYYDAWCADADIPLDVVGPVNGVYSLTLKAGLYSSYDYGAIPAAFPTIELPGHLDEANWLLNQHFTVGASPYTTNEVQAALWTLLGDQDRVATLLPGIDATRVQTLVDLALQNDGFAPDITDDNPDNDEIGLLLDLWKDSNNNGVRDANEVVQQPLIVMVKSAALGDRVWHDVNADGIQNVGGDGAYTEQGIAGAVVRLVRDRDGDGDFTSAGEVLATTTTDADGNYVFKGLAPGLDYQVQFFTPTGFDAASPRQQGASNAADSDGALSDVVVLSAGEWNKTIDAGFYKHVSVGDFVWNDQDADGIQDGGEAGIGGVRLTLTGTTGSGETVVRSTVTAADGSYLFDALPPGTYQVSVDAENFDPAGALSGFQPSPIGQGTDAALDSNASPTGTDPLTLLSGQTDTDLDFGYFKATAAIGDRVWEDTNANGQQEAGENGIAGATVRLYTCVNGAPGTLVSQTTTDASGNYAFAGLMPGQYVVAFETPAGYQLSSADVGADDALDSDAGSGGLTGCYTLASGETNNTVDAGFWRPAAIGDRVWLDANANGQQDAGEAGVAGVAVELYACANGAAVGAALATTTTDAAGNYAFTGLMPGQYVVKFLTPDGYSLSPVDVGADGTDSDAALSGFTGCYTLASGQTNDTVDAGLYQGAAIGDRVWEDTNANGQQDAGENGIAGATVRLYTCVDGAPGALVATTTTDASGNYAFAGLMPGQYVVAFETPAGYQLSSADVGADDALDSDAGSGGLTGCYTLASGETNNTVDAGFWRPAAIGDRVWLDANANGQQDAGEAGVAGVAVELYACIDGQPSGAALAATTTDATGNYSFTGLKPGDYLVKFITPAGFSLSPVNVGADGTDSDAGLGGFTGCYNLESGETDNSVDAGLYQGATIGDRVWEDTNANGQQDAGEAGVAGVAVELYACANGAAVGAALATTTTDAAGNYAFTGLMPGQYVVKFLTPDGYSLSPVDVGADGTDSDAALSGFTGCYTLASGQTNDTVDAGLYQGAAIGDRVWEDTDADGVQDAGENGIADATVRLYTCVDGAPGTLVATTTTDASGNYAFAGLVPGQYIVAFETPAGYQLSTADVGADDGLDSDAGSGGLTGCYSLASGETNDTVDAGFWRPAAIGDRVWLDANANGQQDDGEAGVEGVEVELYTCVDGAPGVKVGASTFTDAAGNYSFTGLEPGDYLVKFITPTGFFLTNQNVGANDTADSDADATTGFTGCYKLEAGETDSTADAGIFKPGEGGVVASIDLVKLTNGTDNNAPTGPYLAVGSTATFQYLVTNDGMVALSDIVLSDDHGTPGDTNDDFTPIFLGGDADGDGLLDVGETWIYEASTVVSAGQYTNLGAVTGTPVDADGNPVPSLPQPTDTDLDNHFGARVAIDIEKFVRGVHQDTGGGGEGLTPGFWKTHSEYGPAPLAGWPETGYSPDDAWEAVFGIDVPGAPTLLDALNAAGGGLDALLRHSSAALLNAAQPNVDYAYTSSQVISLTRDAILSGDLNQIESVKNQFVMQNELGADLSTPASGGATVTTPWFDADAPGTGPFIALGGTAEFRYEVRNTGDVALEGVSVSDDRLSGLSFEGGDTDHDGLLDLDEVWVYSGSELADTAGVDIANVGTATGSALGIMATDADAARYSTAASTQSLGDFVWLDANRNGLQDGGEAGIGGMLVTLTGGGADGIINGVGDTTAITSTDVDGYYQFDNLAAGVQYQVTFGKPAGTAFTMRDAGADDAIDSDAGADGKSQIVTLSPGQHNPSVDAGVYVLNPGIDLEKTTSGPSNANPTAADYDNEDTPDGAGVPVLTAGSAVTWTYKLTNTGNVDFAKADLALVDDNGTPTNAADDMSTANGKIAYVSGDDGDNVLEAGESWLYEAHGTVQSLGVLGAATTIDFSGNTAVDGTDGNTRSYSAGGVTVQANAWSRTKGSDTWQKAWLGAYDAGLGVTDSSESGSGSTHTVDNYGRDNYIVFQFSQDVVVDKAFLGYVVGDSDMTVYVGSSTAPITAMNNAVLAGMSLKEFNDTGSTSARWADFNAGDVQGNVLILAARDDGHSSDYFKVEKLVFEAVQSGGVYANTATVTAPGGLSDSDMSHYESAAKIVAAPKFFVVDQAKDLSYQYADGGDGLGSFALANTDPRDIAANADGSLLWVLDRDKNVEVYKGDGTQLGQWKAYGLGTEPEGITLDGKDLWMADRTGKLNWYDNAATRTSGTDSPELSFTLSLDGNLKGIVTDGTYLWAVTEGTCDYVYRFKIVRDWWGNPSGLSQSGGWQLPTANTKPTGITLDPSGKSDSLWIVDESTDTVYEYGYGRSQTWGVGTITAKFKLSAGNTAPQGIADPLPAGAEAFDLAEISAAAGLETTQPDPYAGDFVTSLFDDAIAFHDAGIVGTSAQSEATLALLHA